MPALLPRLSHSTGILTPNVGRRRRRRRLREEEEELAVTEEESQGQRGGTGP